MTETPKRRTDRLTPEQRAQVATLFASKQWFAFAFAFAHVRVRVTCGSYVMHISCSDFAGPQK